MSGPYGNFVNGWPINDSLRLIGIYDDPSPPWFYHSGKSFSQTQAISLTLTGPATSFQGGIGFRANMMLAVLLAGAPPAGSVVQSGLLIAPGGFLCLDQRPVVGIQDGLPRTAIGAVAV